jgi:hypothetical protein
MAEYIYRPVSRKFNKDEGAWMPWIRVERTNREFYATESAAKSILTQQQTWDEYYARAGHETLKVFEYTVQRKPVGEWSLYMDSLNNFELNDSVFSKIHREYGIIIGGVGTQNIIVQLASGSTATIDFRFIRHAEDYEAHRDD